MGLELQYNLRTRRKVSALSSFSILPNVNILYKEAVYAIRSKENSKRRGICERNL